MAHIWRNEDETPNDLLPINNKVGTVSPINGPATYQAHGCVINSNIDLLIKFEVKRLFILKTIINYKINKTHIYFIENKLVVCNIVFYFVFSNEQQLYIHSF